MSPSTQMKTTKLGCALTIALCLTLVLLTVLLYLTISWRIRRNNVSEGREQMLCEPCSALGITGTPPYGCNKTKEERCCCKASWVIDTLVNQSSSRLSKDREFYQWETAAVVNLECGDTWKTVGKVAGLDYKTLTDELREKDLVYWDKSDRSILQSVRHNNGRFHISVPGFYYVFSQLKYAHDPESVKDDGARQSHTLQRYSFKQGRKETLMESTRAFSELYGPENNGTSFIGAVFQFEKEDQIMIKTTHTHKLSGDESMNLFSLYII